MRILLTNTGPWGSGSFMVVEALAREYMKLGHEVKIFFPDSGLDAPDKDKYYGNKKLYDIWQFPVEKNGIKIPVFPTIIPDSLPRSPDGITFADMSVAQFDLYYQELAVQLKRVIVEFKPDAIECQHIWAMPYVLHKLGYPYIVNANMSDQMGFRRDARMQPLACEAAQNAKHVFAISEHVKDEVLELIDLIADQITVIPNGFDRAFFKPMEVNRQEVLASLKVDIPADAIILTFSGRILQRKGIDTIFAANKLLDPKLNILILMFGKGDVKKELDINDERFCFDRVHFLGHQGAKALAAGHNIAKLSVAPSRHEGFGLAVLEAMACGLPVIVAKDTAPQSFVVGGVIDPDEPKELAASILKIINMTDDEYNKLCDKAYAVADTYSWEHVAKERLKYYESVAS